MNLKTLNSLGKKNILRIAHKSSENARHTISTAF